MYKEGGSGLLYEAVGYDSSDVMLILCPFPLKCCSVYTGMHAYPYIPGWQSHNLTYILAWAGIIRVEVQTGSPGSSCLNVCMYAIL